MDMIEGESMSIEPHVFKRIIKVSQAQQREEVEGIEELSGAALRIAQRIQDDSKEEYYDDWIEDYDECGDINPEEEDMLNVFNKLTTQRRLLSDIVMEKIAEFEARALSGAHSDEVFPQKVIDVYTGVGKLLSEYTSGRLPKAFNIIQSLKNWEDVLMLTNPEQWSVQAVAAATKVFSSGLSVKHAQRFYYNVLLPRVRDDIDKHKKLNFHLFLALKYSLFKPASFFKGFLLPLASEECTGREAFIVSSLLRRVSIPVLYSAAGLLKLCELPYSGPVLLFIKVLLNKKYALPTRVIVAVTHYFLSFKDDPRQFPVIWHQALLVFAQRYKSSLVGFRDEIEGLLRIHAHSAISPEIKRELRSVQ